ncbi:class I SAM-dependent methyltransferase [Christiangramia sp. SM2212]|uniref:Class I SAM-dependent methyltransferase n=1 Tax=Christiangramia sediminicola TaxID=3073267 RepID=A0ABU1ET12_9FLAO|nr:class I SAM-dependent methyltransferase [Christiangramia sp. SM2212]MDR5591543.1 class I SAM-dependent methyltransferase [Christiangramia sp. SM2212]
MSLEKAYNQWSTQYDTNKNRTRDLDQKLTIEVLEKLHFKSVLELGCGTGKNTQWLESKCEKLLAVDFSEEMLTIAETKINNDHVKFQRADITKKWSWTSEKFDLITCNLILEHIKDLDFIFSQANEKLKENGYFFISELHPFKQYVGSKARFESEEGLIELETYTHHISEFLDVAGSNKFHLVDLQEWFDEENENPPRILSLLFQK